MIAWALLAASLAADPPRISVNMSPDHPVPVCFLDEPVLVEVGSSRSQKLTLTGVVEIPGREPVNVRFDPVRALQSHPVWSVVRDLPYYRGPHTLRLAISSTDGYLERQFRFSRVERYPRENLFPLVLEGDSCSDYQLRLARYVPIANVRFAADSTGLAERIDLAKTLGYGVHVVLDLAEVRITEDALRKLLDDLGASVDAWEIRPGNNFLVFRNSVETIRSAGNDSELFAMIADAGELETLMQSEPVFSLDGLVLDSGLGAEADSQRRNIRALYSQSGIEHVRIIQRNPGQSPESPVVQAALSARADRLESLGIDIGDVVGQDGPRLQFSELNAVLTLLAETRYIGAVSIAQGTHARVYRVTNPVAPIDTWILAFWSDDDPAEVSLRFGSARQVELLDSLRNPTVQPEAVSNLVVLRAATSPQYLRGAGGMLPARAAAREVVHLAAAAAQHRAIFEQVAPELLPVIDVLRNAAPQESHRFEFFTLLQSIPALEEARAQGTVPAEDGALAIAALARLARAVCTYEQESGQAFLEPLREALDRAEEFQLAYRNAIQDREVSDPHALWLPGEIRRLSEEAMLLERQRLGIEADAVAALAEWRARGLMALARPRQTRQSENVDAD